MKDKNIFSCPTLRWYEIAYGEFDVNSIQKQKGIEYIDPEIVIEWVDKTLKYREKMGEKALKEELDFYAKEIEERLRVINRLNKEGVKILLSPDSSSKFIVPGFGMMDEMKLYQKAGLSNYDILKTGTVNFANYFNDTSTGSIEVGKNADFLILNENPLENIDAFSQIDGIFFNNNFFNKQKLEELAFSVLQNKN
jgi:imidazolonepropionase-like amidohydrolase